MAKLKTHITKVTPKDFIAKVPNETRRKDAEVLLRLFEKITGWKPKMWGPTIVGYGSMTYTYETGHSGDICVVGFSPRGANIVLYSGIWPEDATNRGLLKSLGKHKSSKACIYVNKLADVDMAALEKLLKAGLAARLKEGKEKSWPVKPT